MGTDSKITLDEYTTTLISLKARALVGKYGFTKSDREDIEQDLTLGLLTRLSCFDPDKARSATFVRMVVDDCTASLIRKRKALVRDYRRSTSLDELQELVDQDDSENLAELSYDDREQRELAIDMAEALKQLPAELRSIAEALRDGGNLAEVARAHGLTREAARWRVKKIGEHFARLGLGAYIAHNQNGDAPRK
ncbi:MAG: sigma-70 family RNA polymerase sigma factor [Phycisphaerae bacterium]|nr:sigma-70 family RNA polymerase sigma factor [Planctomycetia bacterium]MCL4719394.1 sigma-70 family RNA polymerase sigma factor [Phycisphaerae bacterium]